jgi:hypothetical protein
MWRQIWQRLFRSFHIKGNKMKLRNHALNRGTSALISTQTHVENGSKIAKGQDGLGGVMSQFSSLMSVMQDDFAMMNDMEREYEGERSEVEPVLPIDTPVLDADNDRSPVFEEEVDSQVVPLDNDAVLIERDYTDLISDTVPLSLPEMTEHPALFQNDFEILSEPVVDVVNFAADSAPSPVMAPVPVDVSSGPERLNQTIVLPPKEVFVPTPEELPKVFVGEVLESVSTMLVEQVEVEDDAPRFEQSGRLEVPDFVRREMDSLFEELTLEDELIPEVESENVLKSELGQAVQVQVEEHLASVIPQQSDLQAGLQAVMTSVVTQGVQAVQTVQPASTVSVDSVAIQQQKTEESMKEVKLPKMHLTRQSFEQLLEESQESGKEQMGFSSKLIQRLEMVIMDPMGRMDVEVAQEVSGVNVKAVVPVEIISSLSGIEGELQVALEQQGLELNHFELSERSEDSKSQGRTDVLDEDVLSAENDTNEKSATGGMLVNRRV